MEMYFKKKLHVRKYSNAILSDVIFFYDDAFSVLDIFAGILCCTSAENYMHNSELNKTE